MDLSSHSDRQQIYALFNLANNILSILVIPRGSTPPNLVPDQVSSSGSSTQSPAQLLLQTFQQISKPHSSGGCPWPQLQFSQKSSSPSQAASSLSLHHSGYQRVPSLVQVAVGLSSHHNLPQVPISPAQVATKCRSLHSFYQAAPKLAQAAANQGLHQRPSQVSRPNTTGSQLQTAVESHPTSDITDTPEG